MVELKPEWLITLELIQPPIEWPPKVNQKLFDIEIDHIMIHGVSTPLALLRKQGTVSSNYSKEKRDRVRKNLFEKQKGLCHWCKKAMVLDNKGGGFASFEHLLPRSHGGRFTPDNIVLAHKTCNHHRESKRHRLARYAHDPMLQGGWHGTLPREVRSDVSVHGDAALSGTTSEAAGQNGACAGTVHSASGPAVAIAGAIARSGDPSWTVSLGAGA
jgi:5-methylcytosine-specific restriction endonuclease McrA